MKIQIFRNERVKSMIIACYILLFFNVHLFGQVVELTKLNQQFKDLFSTNGQKIEIEVKAMDNDKEVDKSMYQYYKKDDYVFIRFLDMEFVKEGKLGIAVDHDEKQITISKNPKDFNFQKSFYEDLKLEQTSDYVLKKSVEGENTMYILNHKRDQESVQAKVIFTPKGKPIYMESYPNEEVEVNGSFKKVKLTQTINYTSNFKVVRANDIVIIRGSKYIATGKYKHYKIIVES
jgi:hypothetical protein